MNVCFKNFASNLHVLKPKYVDIEVFTQNGSVTLKNLIFYLPLVLLLFCSEVH